MLVTDPIVFFALCFSNQNSEVIEEFRGLLREMGVLKNVEQAGHKHLLKLWGFDFSGVCEDKRKQRLLVHADIVGRRATQLHLVDPPS